MADEIRTYNILDIMDFVPHRYPFLLLDRITECVPNKYAKGYKNVTYNEQFFTGHFPENPVMPGVLQLEAMAQCGAAILYDEFKGKQVLFAGIDNARFKEIVTPGDRLEFHVELTKMRKPVIKIHGVGMVDGKVAVEADLTLCVR